jgi:hypothetical protein
MWTYSEKKRIALKMSIFNICIMKNIYFLASFRYDYYAHDNKTSLSRMDTQDSIMYNTITKLARTLFGTATRRKPQPAGNRFRPRLECLEERAGGAYNLCATQACD